MIIEFDPNNIDNPLPNETFTAAQAIQAVNRLLWSEDVQDDDFEDARVIKAFLVGTLPNIPAPVKHSKTIPVMETTIEGAQKRIAKVIEAETEGKETYLISDLEYIAVFLDSVGDEMAAISSSCNSLHARYVESLARLDQLQSDFDSVDAEATNHLADKIRMQKEIDEWKDNFESVSQTSLRRLNENIELQKEIDRLREENIEQQREIAELRRENGEIRRGNLNNLHAAHDNR